MGVIRAFVSVGVLAWLLAAGPAGAGTLEGVKQRGFVRCGVSDGVPGFSAQDASGAWKGLDVDLCRAVAAAVLGDAAKVRFTALSVEKRLEALRAGEVDLLCSNTTWTMERDTTLGLACLHRMRCKALPLKTAGETLRAYEAGRCTVLTSDQSQLYGLRTLLADPGDSVILPEVISKEPLGPYVRAGDDAWFDTVRWTLYTLINAEEAEVDSRNVDRIRNEARNPDIRRLLGLEGGTGSRLGLHPEWGYNIIKQVGNYGESFERNVGEGSPLRIKRGLNALWKDGGLQYAPPAR